MEILIERTYLAKGVNGVMSIDRKIICFSIELPWNFNSPQKSCIPEGRYLLKPRYNEKFKHHWELEGVKGRMGILIHPANDALKELKGCIALVSTIKGAGQGKESQAAMEKLRQCLQHATEKKEQIFLTLKEHEQ